jgi:crotonobetainyl-CoA:carnitine CoA-transferase CaiB-like acyl-CoA transferase
MIAREGTGARGPLAGYRVLDLSSVIMGPLATQMLGDLGADVVTVEAAGGDINRRMIDGPAPTLSGISLNILRNKRSIALDLKKPQAREVFLKIAATCDAMVTNLRPDPLKRLGLTYEEVRSARPDIVFCQAAGFSADSARANDPAYDDIIQSASGLADLSRRTTGAPAIADTLIADKLCGFVIVSSVVTALLHRERTGEGQSIEVPMLDVMKAFLLVEHGAAAIPRPVMGPPGYTRLLNEYHRPQRTADGWIHMVPYSAANFHDLFAAAGMTELLDDPRYANPLRRYQNIQFLYERTEEAASRLTTSAWVKVCDRCQIPFTEVADLGTVIDELPDAQHPLAGSYKLIPYPVRFSASPASVRRPAPTTGQHNQEILAEVGYDQQAIDQLIEAGAVVTAS